MITTKPSDQHHHGSLRDSVIAFAVRAAQEGTIETLSLRSVSRELGVSSGAVYRHFKDKDALLSEVAAKGFDALAERFEAAMPFESVIGTSDDATARFVALAKTYVGFSTDSYGLWRLMFGPHGRASLPPWADRPSTYEWLEKSLMELHAFGLIAPSDPAKQFFAWSSLHGLADLDSSPASRSRSVDDMIERQCALIIAALK
ncbi:MAG: TetR/AcrR family transcriptional regulator [Pseudomonadota bacterium]